MQQERTGGEERVCHLFHQQSDCREGFAALLSTGGCGRQEMLVALSRSLLHTCSYWLLHALLYRYPAFLPLPINWFACRPEVNTVRIAYCKHTLHEFYCDGVNAVIPQEE